MKTNQDGSEMIETENENSQESSTETNKVEETQSSEGENTQDEKKIPFHEDPKVQDYINRQMETREAKLLADLDAKYGNKNDKKPQSDIPAWFGGDEDQWKEFQEYQNQRVADAKTEAIKEIELKEQKEKDLLKAATDHFETSMKEIEGTGVKVDRNRILKIAQDFQLVDTQGRWNYKAAAEIAKAQDHSEVPNNDGRKKIIANDKDNKAEPPKKEVMTNVDFQKFRPW